MMSRHKPETCPQTECIRALGARVTPARVAVLRLLQQAERALSHRDVEEALHAAFDRVTLYRVLDWLVDSGLAHRVTDADRVFRFSPVTTAGVVHDKHAHFRCEACGKVFCLDDVPLPVPHLPAGFSGKSVEYSISGQCAACDHTKKKES